MKVEVLSTGTELLRGKNVDTHLGFFARELYPAGLEVAFHQTCGDDFGRIVDALKLAATRADVILMTGGLGPTEDDHTRGAVEEAFHRPLKFHPPLWKAIQDRFRKNRIRMASINRRQAFIPDGAKVLANPNGSAPGFALREGEVYLAALPGPPKEMHPMFRDQVLPAIRVRRDFETWEGKVYGVPEGTVDEITLKITKDPDLYGLTVRWGQVTITLRAAGPSRKKTLAGLAAKLARAFGDNLYAGELHEHVGRRLIETKTSVALAESCTGGLIAHRLTEVPGISAALLEGCVAYSNEAKIRRLGVPENLIRERGAVSAEVARAMARGVAATSGADLGVAVTGIAGPSGATAGKPAGLCFLAVGDWVEEKTFTGDRSMVKERAAGFALNMLRLRLLRGEGYAGTTMGVRGLR
ncbi:MAG TPA: CinA family nicotinamide mononucleotide deamidase-related protein [Planctomycetota bacterium]